MIKVRAYLPAFEQFNSIVDTVENDVTDLGEQAHSLGIPEAVIVPMETSEQSNEGDKVIHDIFNRQDKEEEKDKELIKEGEEESEGGGTDDFSSDDNSEGTAEIAENGDDGESEDFTTGDSTETTQVEDEPTEEKAEEETDEDEDKTEDINFAVESYDKLLSNAGDTLSEQSAAFLSIGVNDLARRVKVTSVSNEEYSAEPLSIRHTTQATEILATLEAVRTTVTNHLK